MHVGLEHYLVVSGLLFCLGLLGVIARRRFLRRKQRTTAAAPEPEPELEPVPKHVRVLPQPEAAVAEAALPPWERGFDDTEERRP